MNSNGLFLFLFEQYGSQPSPGEDYTAECRRIRDYKLSCSQTRNFRLLLWQLKFSPFATQPAHFPIGTSTFSLFLPFYFWNTFISESSSLLTLRLSLIPIFTQQWDTKLILYSQRELWMSFKTLLVAFLKSHHSPGISTRVNNSIPSWSVYCWCLKFPLLLS